MSRCVPEHERSATDVAYLEKFNSGMPGASSEEQLIETIKIHSNLAQCHLYLKQWSEARVSATAGLEICSLPSVTVECELEEKLRHRRACAAQELGGCHLDQAAADCRWILEHRSNTETEELLKAIECQRSSREQPGSAGTIQSPSHVGSENDEG